MRTFGPARAGIKSDGATNPGAVTITRSLVTEINIIPARWNIGAEVNSGLNVKLDLCYTASELGSLNESNLKMYRKPSGGNWSEVGTPTITISGAHRCAAMSSVAGFSEWALGTQAPSAPTVADMGSVRGKANSKGHAVMRWTTLNELNLLGFNVYRRLEGKNGANKHEWKQINVKLIDAKKLGAVEGAKYHIADKKVKKGNTYRYKLQILRADGTSEWSEIVKIEIPE
jgi:hypothetical protein